MTKVSITENQCAVLEAAARSANLIAWPVPRKLGLNPGSATIAVKGLLKKGVLEERPVLGEDAAWRADEEGRKLTVVITKAGMGAVGMAPGAVEEGEAVGKRPPHPARTTSSPPPRRKRARRMATRPR